MKRAGLFLWLAFLAIIVQAQNITGQIFDSQTGDSIPFAALRYRGHKISMVSNYAGRFSIERHVGWKLTFSSVGYKSESVEITENTPSHLTIRLRPDAHELNEVTVKGKRHRYRRKDNPAVELMRRVIAAKKRTDLGNHPYYEYYNYQKLRYLRNSHSKEPLKTGILILGFSPMASKHSSR